MLNGARLHESLTEPLRRAFEEVLGSGRFIGGDAVASFESGLAGRLGVTRAVGTSSGTDALTVALSALDVRPGDEVITTPYTFIAVAGALVRLGAVPVFVDIDLRTFNIDPGRIRDAITSRTVGILPVHLFGQCADMTSICETASEAGVWVLEDASQSLGAEWNGRCAGGMGIAGAISFFPAKNLGALGDAGAVVTNDNDLAEKMTALRNHGSTEKDLYRLLGGNHRLDALQAAFLSVKLPCLSAWLDARKRSAEAYRAALEDLDVIVLPERALGSRHVYNQFIIRTQERNALRAHLAANGIETAVYYPRPLSLQPCLEFLGHTVGDFPNAERAASESLALPMDPLLTESELGFVSAAIRDFFERGGNRFSQEGSVR